MEIKALDCLRGSPLQTGTMWRQTGCVMKKAELFTSDLRAAFVMTCAKDGIMLSLAV